MESGIYTIRNINDGKIYVGSAVNFKNRWAVHTHHLIKNKHHSRYLQRAWNKYGQSAFEFSVIETCEKSDLIAREQYWIDHHNAADPAFGYNLSPTANSSLGVKHTSITRKRMSVSSQKRSKTPEPFKVYLRGKFVGEYQRQKDCELALGIPGSRICECLKGTRCKHAKGYTFVYNSQVKSIDRSIIVETPDGHEFTYYSVPEVAKDLAASTADVYNWLYVTGGEPLSGIKPKSARFKGWIFFYREIEAQHVPGNTSL